MSEFDSNLPPLTFKEGARWNDTSSKTVIPKRLVGGKWVIIPPFEDKRNFKRSDPRYPVYQKMLKDTHGRPHLAYV
ncbi:MAG: hypothetical protein KAS32_23240 [Candidatus Peribacteraceae bacterium]|nr:hypothetical protein [Candidatus Peribacteraceae bacterium]